MKSYTLITSPVKTHKRNYKYFNYGCLNLLNNTNKKNILINHPWDNHKNYFRDSHKIKKIYTHILEKISQILNNHHKIKKDLRYWKILIGPWLHSFIVAHYEKNLSIDLLLKSKKKMIIPVVDLTLESQIPDNFFTFFSKHIYDPSWNDFLFTTIISKKNLSKNFILKKKISTDKKNSKKKNGINSLNNLVKFLINFVSFIFLFRIRNQSLAFFNTYLSFRNKLFLIFRNLSLPIHLDKKSTYIYPDISLRKSLIKAIDSKNDFYNNILKLSVLNMPTDLLENFSNVGKKIFKSNVALNPKVIFTANGIYGSSFEARYIAECTSKGTRLILAQHGGRYENIKNFFHIDYEVDISDYFISWGRKKNNSKIKNLGIIKPLKFLNKDNDKRQKILFLMMAKGRFYRTIDSEINIKKLYNYYDNICPNFYSLLKQSLKERLIFRSSINNYWNEKEILMKRCKFSEIDFDRQKSDLFSAAEKSRVVVCSYFSTTFMELMSANIPVTLFTPFSHEGYNSETLKIFDIMSKCKIYFKSHEDSAKFVNKNWENINEWWFSKKVQKSRKIFLDYFSIENPRLIYDIQQLIDQSKKKSN